MYNDPEQPEWFNKIMRAQQSEKRAYGSASATGYLPGSSVKTLLEKWEEDAGGWEASEKSWREHQQTESDAMRMNCCRVRAATLRTVIADLRAEMARTNKRQPEDNSY